MNGWQRLWLVLGITLFLGLSAWAWLFSVQSHPYDAKAGIGIDDKNCAAILAATKERALDFMSSSNEYCSALALVKFTADREIHSADDYNAFLTESRHSAMREIMPYVVGATVAGMFFMYCLGLVGAWVRRGGF